MADVDVLARVIGFAGLGLAAYSFVVNRRASRITALKLIHAKVESLRAQNNKRAMKLRNMRDSYNAAHIQSELIDCCINEVAQLECLINKQSLTIRDGKKTIMVRILGIGDGDMFIIETSLDRALATSSIIDDNILALQERLQKVADVVPCAEKDKKSVGVVEA